MNEYCNDRHYFRTIEDVSDHKQAPDKGKDGSSYEAKDKQG